MFRFVSLRMVPVLLGLVPVAVAAAWIPFRNDLPNTDVALLLVLCVGAVAMIGGRWTAVIGAVTAATAFDLFDTPPYWQLYMTRGRDVVTTLILVGAGLLVGELCVRVRRYRVMAATRGEDFAVIERARLASWPSVKMRRWSSKRWRASSWRAWASWTASFVTAHLRATVLF